VNTVGSSVYLIHRDPFRAIRRGRQLFQLKFTRSQGQGPNESDGVGDIDNNIGIGAGSADSCALCHGRPRGSAGAGGNVVTRPDSPDAGHLFCLGLKEMLVDEISSDLRSTRDLAITLARELKRSITLKLDSKGFGIWAKRALISFSVNGFGSSLSLSSFDNRIVLRAASKSLRFSRQHVRRKLRMFCWAFWRVVVPHTLSQLVRNSTTSVAVIRDGKSFDRADINWSNRVS